MPLILMLVAALAGTVAAPTFDRAAMMRIADAFDRAQLGQDRPAW